MDKIKIIFCLLTLFSCNGQNKEKTKKENVESKTMKTMKYFDIKRFEKNQKNGEYLYTDSLGNQVREFFSGRKTVGYGCYVKFYNTPQIEELNHFYHNGILKEEGKIYDLGGDFRIGVWKFYDESGILIKEINYDKPFEKYPLEKVLEYMKSRQVNLSAKYTRIYREINKNGIPMWHLTWDAGEKTEELYGLLRNVEIDAQIGERIKEYHTYYDVPVEDKFVKDLSLIIIFDKKQETTKKKESYRTHNGKSYTEEEWKIFEEQEYQKYQEKKNKKGFLDKLFGD